MKNQPSRRQLIQAAGAAAIGASCAAPAPEPEKAPTAKRRIPLAVSTYSYWHFTEEKYPIEKVIDHAASLGFDGVEILHRQMRDESAEYMNDLKRRAWDAGLGLPMLSIHQDFVDPKLASARRRWTTPSIASTWRIRWVFRRSA